MAAMLVVEDNEVLRGCVVQMLTQLGHAVVALPNGRDLVDGLVHEPPDIVLTDVFMPDVDGLEAIAATRQRYPKARVVVMTAAQLGFTAETIFAWAQAVGADALLRKPFTRAELIEALAS